MYKRRYHIFSGIVSLVISIVLPTLIHHYYFLIQPWNDAMLQGNTSVAIAAYGVLLMLVLLLVIFLVIALRELGGYMTGIMEGNDSDVKVHNSRISIA